MADPYPNLMRYLRDEDSGLSLDPVEDDASGWQGWQVSVDNPDGEETLTLDGCELACFHGQTPGEALAKAERYFAAYYARPKDEET